MAKNKKSKIKEVKTDYSPEYKQEKVSAFIAKVKKTQGIFSLWRIAVGGVISVFLMMYGKVANMPQMVQIIFLLSFLTLLIPTFMLKKATKQCPVCGNKIGKILGVFHKVCPHCHTDLDPENRVVVFK